MVRQVSKHLKLTDQPGMPLGVKPAEWLAPFGVLVLLLKPSDVLREPFDQILLVRQGDLLPSRAGRTFGGWSNGHDMPPLSQPRRASSHSRMSGQCEPVHIVPQMEEPIQCRKRRPPDASCWRANVARSRAGSAPRPP